MSNKPLHFDIKAKAFFIWLGLFLALTTCALIANFFSYKSSINHAIDNIEHRIILDSAFIDIGSKTLGTPVNQYAVRRYITRLNNVLKTQKTPVIVLSIQNVSIDIDSDTYPSLHEATFDNAEQTISIQLKSKSLYQSLQFSWTAFIASILLVPLFSVTDKTKPKSDEFDDVIIPPSPRLIISLQDKTISNGVDNKAVNLQNKPLCFYTALVKYCIENPGESLPPHKDIPHELMTLANKSFGRLIELGHTKRKRPDFNANLDKTLSEIRAALDEVFADFPEEKDTFYPPRAQGEGSRSKQHSYALVSIKEDNIEIIGN
ncbi:hypothetical protein BK026_11585 [Alteromonas sp. V450]|uniref:hypothetical protein n=1 Tax=Alteromonas sp. V450 TaxID=1912139 RepID=UPI0008FF1BAD|nr:hypothetical protein [Alteromonas sp. V450]OJF69380.1 hypothetical protein BK026_11585 [Alteromonas sp. V450]